MTRISEQGLGSCIWQKEIIMTMTRRILLCIGILLVDLAVFALPLTALFLIYILLVNPPWFRDFLNRLDDSGGTNKNK
jgi:hypothetical protein